jgi:putative tricarboxylic transport membrane protein
MAKCLSNVFTMIVASSLFCATSAFAQESFYKGKVIRIIVATAAGGGYDLYTRTMARHLRKYIPGEPTIAVENMPGAGHLIGANYVYKVAKPDGLTMGHFIGTLFLQQLLGKPGVEFDALKFNFIGVPAQDNYMIGLSKTTGITSMEQWLTSKRVIKIGGIGAGSATDDIPKVLAATIGLPLQVAGWLQGYVGSTAGVQLG